MNLEVRPVIPAGAASFIDMMGHASVRITAHQGLNDLSAFHAVLLGWLVESGDQHYRWQDVDLLLASGALGELLTILAPLDSVIMPSVHCDLSLLGRRASAALGGCRWGGLERGGGGSSESRSQAQRFSPFFTGESLQQCPSC